ncbi:MAG: POTRA domain-containing protein [Terracidiphilus sp.]
MKRKPFLLFAVLVVFAASLPVAAQMFVPKTIQFKGVPEYSDQELLSAAGLKKGEAVAYSDVNGDMQKLLDTGLFASCRYVYNGVDLIFTLAPSPALYLVRLENLPLAPGKELDAALHNRLPLYHGKVPFDGGLTEQVRQALEEMLAAKGIKATVVALPRTDPKLNEVTAMGYSITTPPVRVGEIHLDGASAPLDPNAMEILSKLTGKDYDLEGSPSQIETYLGNYYHDKGYLEAAIHATAQTTPVIAPEAIHIPFQVSVAPGALYKLKGIQLAPDIPITQAEFDHQSRIDPGDTATSQDLIEDWQFIEQRYHNKGYMRAVVRPTPSFDRAQATVSFTVTAEPGPVYTMGKLTIENTADDLRAAMLAAWKMPAGAVFNQAAAIGFYATHDVNPALERTIASNKFIFSTRLNDETHTVDVALRLEKKH